MESAKPSSFSLNKLYLDCIDEKGNCFVIHQFMLKVGFMRYSWSGLLFSDTAGITHEISSMKKTENTTLRDLLIFFNHNLDIKGSWNRIDPALPPQILSDPVTEEFSWNCHHPKADTEVVFNENSYFGLGFAESVKLSVSPFTLRVTELHCGHFLSPEHTVVWLYWNGNFPVSKLWYNGVEYNDPVQGEEGIVFGTGRYRISFKRKIVIRKALLTEIMEDLPLLRLIYRRQAAGITEERYKAVSELSDGTGVVAKGWSLIESMIRRRK